MGAMNKSIQNKLVDFVEQSCDGYCILSRDDDILYCNQAFAKSMMINHDQSLGMKFEDILQQAYETKTGINIEASTLEEFIAYTRKVRRSKAYRIFEVDFTDGRWFLFSEQLNEEGELFVQLKDITRQKTLESDLQNSVESLTELSLTDELTKIANRRALVDSVEMELSRCRRTGASMSMLVLDLDYFKVVNDQYGHPAGDAALIHVTEIFSQSLRQYDILGRIGGEEFAVFLSNTTIEKSMEIAERIRTMVESSSFSYEGHDIPLTVSIGQTTLGCNTVFDELYSQADQALYSSKTTGRNKVTSFYDIEQGL